MPAHGGCLLVPQIAVAAAAAAAGLTAARLGASPDAIADAVAAAVNGVHRWASHLVMPPAPVEDKEVMAHRGSSMKTEYFNIDSDDGTRRGAKPLEEEKAFGGRGLQGSSR